MELARWKINVNMRSVPSESADGSNTYLVSWTLDPPAYAGGTDLMARIVHKKKNASAVRKPRSHVFFDCAGCGLRLSRPQRRRPATQRAPATRSVPDPESSWSEFSL